MTQKDHHPQVALSYASEHEAYAAEVESCLQTEGYDVFNYKGEARRSTTRDSLSVGLIEVFKNADLCVLMVSEAYTESKLCQEESATAHSRLINEGGCLILGIFGKPTMPKGAKADAEYVQLDNLSATTFARERIIAALRGKSILPPEDGPPTEREQRYGLFFGIPGYRMAYIPASLERTWHEYHSYEFSELEVTAKQEEFTLEKPYRNWPLTRKPPENLPKCRLDSYTEDPNRLRLQIQPTWYEDYLRSGEQIDFTTTVAGGETFREKFLNELSPYVGSLRPFKELTNICGVGLFIVTRDEQIVVSTHSDTSHVYPGRRTFAASGTMPWGACPNPFTAMVNKAQENQGVRVLDLDASCLTGRRGHHLADPCQ